MWLEKMKSTRPPGLRVKLGGTEVLADTRGEKKVRLYVGQSTSVLISMSLVKSISNNLIAIKNISK